MQNEYAAFRLQNVVFGYDGQETVLNGITAELLRGQMTAVMGANGCGKSTLFRLLCGNLKPDSGEIFLEEQEIKTIPRRQFARRVAIVHQYNLAPEDLTVRKLVTMGRTPYHSMLSSRNTEADNLAVERALELTDTAKYANRPVQRLSGGQRQRVWLAMALAQETDILLLDEITTYLDVYYQLQLLRLIQQLRQELNLTVVMVLHDINQAMEFCPATILMEGGRILSQGATEQVICEDNLLQAFRVNTEIHRIGDRRYCIFK